MEKNGNFKPHLKFDLLHVHVLFRAQYLLLRWCRMASLPVSRWTFVGCRNFSTGLRKSPFWRAAPSRNANKWCAFMACQTDYYFAFPDKVAKSCIRSASAAGIIPTTLYCCCYCALVRCIEVLDHGFVECAPVEESKFFYSEEIAGWAGTVHRGVRADLTLQK